jgi:hypothetical protein
MQPGIVVAAGKTSDAPGKGSQDDGQDPSRTSPPAGQDNGQESRRILWGVCNSHLAASVPHDAELGGSGGAAARPEVAWTRRSATAAPGVARKFRPALDVPCHVPAAPHVPSTGEARWTNS